RPVAATVRSRADFSSGNKFDAEVQTPASTSRDLTVAATSTYDASPGNARLRRLFDVQFASNSCGLKPTLDEHRLDCFCPIPCMKAIRLEKPLHFTHAEISEPPAPG